MDFLRFVVAVIVVSDGLLGNGGWVAAIPCREYELGCAQDRGDLCCFEEDGFVAWKKGWSVVSYSSTGWGCIKVTSSRLATQDALLLFCIYVINMPAQTGVWRSVPIHTTVTRKTSTAFVTLLKDERIAFRHNEMIHVGCRVSRLVVLLKLLEMTPIKDYYLVKLNASVRKLLSCN